MSVTALKVTTSGDPTSGGFVITWQSLNQDGGGYGIYQQLYSAAGAAVGGEVKVNTTTTGDQSTPSVTGLADGGWVVTWTSFGQDGALGGIYQQRYDKSGGTVGGETLVNVVTAGAQSEPAVTALSDGGWVVTWMSNVGPDGSLNGIYQRHYGSDGTAGPQLLVNATTPQDQTAPTVTATADGGWIVAWTSQGQDGSGSGIYQRRYTGAGSQLSVNQDYATGSALDEVLNVATGTLNANDVLDGGAGIDTIQYSGTLDWTVGATVTNFEALKGGSGDDTLTITAAQLSMLGLSIDGGAGTGDKIQVTGGGSLDLSDKTITNVEVIELTSSAGTAVTVNAANKNLALLLKGNASANDQVTLQGGAFKAGGAGAAHPERHQHDRRRQRDVRERGADGPVARRQYGGRECGERDAGQRHQGHRSDPGRQAHVHADERRGRALRDGRRRAAGEERGAAQLRGRQPCTSSPSRSPTRAGAAQQGLHDQPDERERGADGYRAGRNERGGERLERDADRDPCRRRTRIRGTRSSTRL